MGSVGDFQSFWVGYYRSSDITSNASDIHQMLKILQTPEVEHETFEI